MKVEIIKSKLKKYLWCIALVVLISAALYFLFAPKNIIGDSGQRHFLTEMEYKTFDLRQNMLSKYRKSSDDIVIIYIDNKTYEAVIEKFGSWPIPRYIYADVTNYVESKKPKLIAFDLMFVGNLKDKFDSDKKLGEVFKKYDNVYSTLNFDDMEAVLREPKPLDEKFSVNVKNEGNVNFPSFTNQRPIIKYITDVTSNIGHPTSNRCSDGVIRSVAPIVKYQNKYYPHLALLVAQKIMNSNAKDFSVDKNLNLKFDKNSYPITDNGEIYLNWYGEKANYNAATDDISSFNGIPMWKVLLASEQYKAGQKISPDFDYDYKDKIVYIATSSINLNDIKVTPINKQTPGVETHTTFINNMLTNSFIHKVDFKADFLITLFLSLYIGLIILMVEDSKIYYKYMIPINSVILIGSVILYYLIATYILMGLLNLWVALVMPITGMILTFIIVYIEKYFMKSKDYEYTYKLATTDGLTELFNHRYFQEQMIANIESSKRYNTNFSMILSDIDFFKKFNDKYGHQAGDAVLRQVAKILKKNVRNVDIVCRYGGEEMSIILPNTDNESAKVVAQKLCEAVSSSIFKLSSTIESHVTISLGVSTYPQDGTTATELIEYADKGLYFAKENGRNQVGVVKN